MKEAKALSLMLRQRDDNGLWLKPTTVREEFLLSCIRELHQAVEEDSGVI